jgi:predicted metal-dependent peptidase
LNLDFDKPTKKLIKLAKEAQIDLKDENVLKEFKLIQIKGLEDIKRLKNG